MIIGMLNHVVVESILGKVVFDISVQKTPKCTSCFHVQRMTFCTRQKNTTRAMQIH